MDVARVVAPLVFAQTGKFGSSGALWQQIAAAMDLARRPAQRQLHDREYVRVNGQRLDAFVALLSRFGQAEREAGAETYRPEAVVAAFFTMQRHGKAAHAFARNMADHAEGKQAVGCVGKRQAVNQFDHEPGEQAVVFDFDLKADCFAFLGFSRAGADHRQAFDQPVRPYDASQQGG